MVTITLLLLLLLLLFLLLSLWIVEKLACRPYRGKASELNVERAREDSTLSVTDMDRG